jgi:hypothetical protein
MVGSSHREARSSHWEDLYKYRAGEVIAGAMTVRWRK